MTSPDSQWINIVFGIVLLMSVMYATGRLHQFYRQNRERDQAFREGYDTATQSLFTVATRTAKMHHTRAIEATVTEITDAPSARHNPRHSAEDRASQQTQRLTYGQRSA